MIEEMRFATRLVTPATSEPMSLARAKSHLRIPADIDDEDEDVSDYLSAAREYIEQAYNIRFCRQDVDVLFENFPRGVSLSMPLYPVQSVNYVRYTDTANNTRELAYGTGYLVTLDARPTQVVLPWAQVWPSIVLQTNYQVCVGITVGFLKGTSPEVLPIPLQAMQAIKLLLTHFYTNKSAVTLGTLDKSDKLQLGVESLMANVRLY